MYSLLFLSSFRFWGVFHKWSLRPPPLADLALPYLLFFMCDFPSSFFYCLTKNNFEKKTHMKKKPDPLTMGPPRLLGPTCLFPHPLYVQKRPPAKPPGLFARI
jgi:hypothetical protein